MCLAKSWLAFKNNLTLCLRHQNSCAMGLWAPWSQTGEWKLVSGYESGSVAKRGSCEHAMIRGQAPYPWPAQWLLQTAEYWITAIFGTQAASPGERLQQCLGTARGTDIAVAEFQPGASWKNLRQSVWDLAGLWHYIVYTWHYVINTEKISDILHGIHLF